MASVYVADLTGATETLAGGLGALTHALLSDAPDAVVFDLGKNASDPHFLGYFKRWWERHEATMKGRCRAIAYVVPGTLDLLKWRMVSLFIRPSMPFKFFRTREPAMAWLAGD